MCKLYQPQGLEKIPKINKHSAFNKAVGLGKNSKIINVGPTSIPESRVHKLAPPLCKNYELFRKRKIKYFDS